MSSNYSNLYFYLFIISLILFSCSRRVQPIFTIIDYGGDPCYETIDYEWQSYELSSKKYYKRALIAEGMSTVWTSNEQHIRPELRMIPEKSRGTAQPKIGVSKWGGRPDLPTSASWPESPYVSPYVLLAQLNLRDIKGFSSENLPKRGWLYFTYVVNEMGCRYNPSPNCFKVFYLSGEGQSRLTRIEEGYYYPGVAITFEEAYGLPAWDYDLINRYANEAEECAYMTGQFMDQYKDIRNTDKTRSKMFGFANEIESYLGNACTDPEEEDGEDDWQLLLQLDSEVEAGMTWQDRGRIYLYIKKSDLKRRNFDDVCALIQGH